jgi:hypothetical protein
MGKQYVKYVLHMYYFFFLAKFLSIPHNRNVREYPDFPMFNFLSVANSPFGDACFYKAAQASANSKLYAIDNAYPQI